MEETVKEEIIITKSGRPWNILGIFDSYKEAHDVRKKTEAEWEHEKIDGMEIKIKRRNSDDKFAVKIRTPQIEKLDKPKTKKKKKTAKRENKHGQDNI